MSENDGHILKRVEKSKIATLWVGIYGDPNSKSNKAVVSRASSLGQGRHKAFDVKFYDASTADVWAKTRIAKR